MNLNCKGSKKLSMSDTTLSRVSICLIVDEMNNIKSSLLRISSYTMPLKIKRVLAIFVLAYFCRREKDFLILNTDKRFKLYLLFGKPQACPQEKVELNNK